MAVTKAKRRSLASLFPGKIRKPVSLTLTPEHHRRVQRNKERLGITRSDLIGLLIEKYAETVTKEYRDASKELRDAVEVLGGSLEHHKRNEPRGGTWVLTLGSERLQMPSEQASRYPLLDACYELKQGVAVSRSWNDHTDGIRASGLSDVLRRLATAEDLVAGE